MKHNEQILLEGQKEYMDLFIDYWTNNLNGL